MSKEQLSTIFNEWAKRYSENPLEWGEVLDENGSPVEDYGGKCAIYFLHLEEQLRL